MSRGAAAWVALACRIVLAGVFVAAGLPKLLDPASFAQNIAAYGLVPQELLFITAILLIAAELATAAGLLLDRFWAVLSAGFLLVMFIGVLGYGIHLGLDIDCGCFGPGDPEHGVLDSLRTSFIRDVVLLIPVAYLLGSMYFKKREA